MESENVNLEQKQITKSTWGGARPGGGRPKGIGNKLKIGDFFSPDEIDRLVLEAKLLAFGDANNKPDKDMIRFVIEQLFGKATQRTVQSDEEGNNIVPMLVKFITDANPNRDTTGV